MEFKLLRIKRRGLGGTKYEVYENGFLKYTAKSFLFKHRIIMNHINVLADPIIISNEAILRMKITAKDDQKVIYHMSKGKKLLSFDHVFQFDDDELQLKGNTWGRKFSIFRRGDEICKISRKVLTRKGLYGIALNENEDDMRIVSMIFGLEIVIRMKSSG